MRKGKPAWRFTSGGVIWRVVPTGLGRLICESRDEQEKRTRFSCIDQSSGKQLWRDVSFGEQWWIGIEAVQSGVLLLHKFAQPDMPEHRSIIAVDIETGSTLWQNADAKFEGVEGSSVVASQKRLAGGVFFQINIRTGEIEREFTSNDATLTQMLGSSSGRPERDGIFPSVLVDLQSDDSSAGRIIRSQCAARSVVGPVMYVERGDYVIFSYHERSPSSTERQPLFNNHVNVLHGGKNVFSAIVNHNVSAMVPECFFVENNILIFMNGRSTLTAVRL